MECVVANVLVGGGCVETAVFTKDVWTMMIAVQEMASSFIPAVLVCFLVVFVALDTPAEQFYEFCMKSLIHCMQLTLGENLDFVHVENFRIGLSFLNIKFYLLPDMCRKL